MLIFTVVSLIGCTTPQWVQSGKTEVNVNNDQIACMQTVAPQMRVFPESVYVLPKGRAFNACMEAKGYQQQLAREGYQVVRD